MLIKIPTLYVISFCFKILIASFNFLISSFISDSSIRSLKVVRSAFGLDDSVSQREIKRILASAYCSPQGEGHDVKMLDYSMKQTMSKYNDVITKACVPDGLIRQFPDNALQLMILSGAKGSAVNAIQFDPSPRAGGYIDQRFLTGINPQELFFHTMAGREGLIDTAVKTSRSGYLQRCLVKHLEGLKIHYDGTVRDHDGSIVQFRYGEDGLDVTKSTYINPKTFPFLKGNLDAVMQCSKPREVTDCMLNVEAAEKQYRKIKKWRKKTLVFNGHPNKKHYASGFTEFSADNKGVAKDQIVAMWAEMDVLEKLKYEKRAQRKCPCAVNEKFNVNNTLGALPEKTLDSIYEFTGKNDKLRRSLFWKGKLLFFIEQNIISVRLRFQSLIAGMRSLAEPGENVGLLAAQSIGEPSTQMTLNTFHFAGRGEMNIPIHTGMPQKRIDMIRRELDKVFLNQVLRKFSIEERVNLVESFDNFSDCWRRYCLRIEILSPGKRQENARYLRRRTIMNEMEQRFLRALANAIAKKYRDVLEYQQIQHRKLRSGNQNAGLGVNEVTAGIRPLHHMDDGNSSEEEAVGGKEADAVEQRLHNRHLDDAAEYEGEEEDRVHVENDDDERQNEAQDDAEETEEEQDNNEVGDGDEKREPGEREITNVDERIKFVISQSNLIVDYKFDVRSERWCEVVFQLPLGNKSKLDLVTIVEKEVDKFVVHQTPGIERCIEIEEVLHDIPTKYLQTQGINLEAFFRHADVLDVNAIQTNDLNLVLSHYGVEACSKAIIQVCSHLLVVVSFTTIPDLSKIGSVLYFLGLGLFFQLHEFQLSFHNS
uniref:DNA-directed RNA polymerase n=1 Tax=Angiostrongylus cantonensis TaxID=6313 RepID=A0A158PB74_ANGCA